MSGTDLSDALSDMWRSVLLFVPTALAFLAILLIGWLLARLLRTAVGKALRRIGFDRAVERGAIGRALGGRAEPSDLCAKLVFYAVLLFALQLAFGLWGPNAVSDLLTALIGWLPRAFVAIVIIVVAAAVGGAARDLIGSALGGLAYGRVLARVVYWLIIALGVIAALDQVQIATAVTQPVLIAVLATVAGVVIVGVGGGLIRPMQQRWDTWLERASTESAAIREHARSYADERARVAAEAKAAEEEAARVAAAKAAEEAAEKARLAEEARIAEEARVEEARIAEQARAEEAERQARETAQAEAARAEAARVEAAETERRRELEAAAAEQTQVIPVQRPHLVPGFDDPEPAVTAESATVEQPAVEQPAARSAVEQPAARSTVEEPAAKQAGAVRADAAGGLVGDEDAARPAGAPGAAGAVNPGATDRAADEDGAAGESRAVADDADTTAVVSGPVDRDSTVMIPRQGSSPEDGERTQVIRARPDDTPKS